MKYKKLKAPLSVVKHIDSFKGVNTADSLYSLKENQLREAVNLWCPNGALKSRPAIKANEETLHITSGDYSSLRVFERNLPPFKAGNYCRIGGVAEVGYFGYSSISFYLSDKNGNKKQLQILPFASPNGNRLSDIQNVVFISGDKIAGSGIFTVITLIEYNPENKNKRILYYELDSNLQDWIAVDKNKFYTPIYLRYGRGNNYLSATYIENDALKEPEILEEINIVNGAFTACFSCDNVSDTFDLPFDNISLTANDPVIVEFFISQVESKVFIFNSQTNSMEVKLFGQQVTINVDRIGGKVSFSKDGSPFSLPRYKKQNALRITAYKYDNDKAYELFSNRAAEAYFDGRLLRAGDLSSSHKIFYSGKDNPLYFHDSAHISVGERAYALTAVASQNRYLFLFKQNEIYRLRLEETRNYDMKEIFEKNLTASFSDPKYTLTVVHSTIGCDCPQSIAFCTNRLVWYHSDGFVYCLYGTNSYTEGSVYALSPSITNELKADISDKYNVSATSHEGYYFLSIGNKIFVMDALVSGFRYLSGLRPDTSAGGGLIWYIWQMNEGVTPLSLNSLSGRFFAVMSFHLNGARGTVFLSEFTEEQQKDSFMVNYTEKGEKDIPVSFSSALITDTPLSKLKKVSLDIDNKKDITARLFSRNFNGRPFLIEAGKKEKRKSIFIPACISSGAGISFSGKGPITLNSMDFEFDVRRI